jgi:hypothetical protein
MKTATLSLLATTVVFAGTSVYLGLELGKTRDALAAAETRATQQTVVRENDEHAFRESVEAEAPPGVAAPDANAPPPPRFGDAGPPPGSRPPNGRFDERAAPGSNSAAAQRQRRLFTETRLREQFADMPGELGLDAATSGKLFDLLADSQVAAGNNRRAYADDPIGARALADAARQERDAQITALLGPDKAAEFLTFEKSIGARMQVGRIDADMTAADIPLRDDQRKAMIVAIAAEQAARPAPQRDPSGDDANYQSEFLAWQAEYSKRVQQQVEPLLTSEQRARYREAVELQNQRRAQQQARAEQRRAARQQQQP